MSGPRGDRICQEALSELKMAVKAAGEHKQKVTIHVALDGLRVRDEKTGVSPFELYRWGLILESECSNFFFVLRTAFTIIKYTKFLLLRKI